MTKTVCIRDSRNPKASPGLVACADSQLALITQQAAYCSFLADERDTALAPTQIARLLVSFYGHSDADGNICQETDLDMTAERARYHHRGRPLPMKPSLMKDKAMARDGLLAAIDRMATFNGSQED